MQYVTIDRGNRLRGNTKLRGSDEGEESVASQIEDNDPSQWEGSGGHGGVTEAPQRITSTGRSLE